MSYPAFSHRQAIADPGPLSPSHSPVRLRATAHLYGVETTRLEQARVLAIGCGAGERPAALCPGISGCAGGRGGYLGDPGRAGHGVGKPHGGDQPGLVCGPGNGPGQSTGCFRLHRRYGPVQLPSGGRSPRPAEGLRRIVIAARHSVSGQPCIPWRQGARCGARRHHAAWPCCPDERRTASKRPGGVDAVQGGHCCDEPARRHLVGRCRAGRACAERNRRKSRGGNPAPVVQSKLLRRTGGTCG